MDENKSLSESMQETIEYGNLEFLDDIGEIMIDATLNDGLLQDVPVIRTIVGVGRCIRNVYDALFAKKLISFLIPIKDVSPKIRAKAIRKWQEDDDYRGKVGETLLGMIQRCDDAVKAKWLSKLFYELVLKRGWSRLFMRAEKTLSSLSVMDVQAFLNMKESHIYHIKESESEPFIGSGLYQNPQIESSREEKIDLSDKYCEPTEIGILIYNVLNNIPMTTVEQNTLF